MVIKKYIILLFALLCISMLHAQKIDRSKPERIYQPDSLIVDSLMAEFTDAERDTSITVVPIEELETYIVSLQDTFFSYDEKAFSTNEYYAFGNSRYIVPNYKGSIGLFHSRFDNFMQPKDQFYSLMNSYVMNTREGGYNYVPLQNSFRALLTDVQYSNGDFNNESKGIGFSKNEFLNLIDFQLYTQSGEHTSPWSHKCYYDNVVFQLEKNLLTPSYSSHQFNYNFIKLFSAEETYNVFNPEYGVDAEAEYFRKTETILNQFDAFLFDKIFHFSYLNQYGKERIYDASTSKARNTIVRHQLNFGIDLPLEEYATSVLLRADLQDIDHFLWKGYLHDYLVHISINSPGIFADFYTIKIINDVIFSQEPDTTFIMPKLVFDIPLTEDINSRLSVGARRKEQNLYYDGAYALDNKTKVIFTKGALDITTNSLTLSLGAFYEEIRNDGQWQWLLSSPSDSPYYTHFDDYHIYGGTIEGDISYKFLTVDSKVRLKGTFMHCPEFLVNYPAYRAKLEWSNKRHFTHKNFIFANAQLSYIGNFFDVKGTKIDHQLFCSAEAGLSLKRFLIYLKLTNILNILDSNYFMYPLNEVNPFGVAFGVQWNFIN